MRDTLKGPLFNTILSIGTFIQRRKKKKEKKTILQTCDTINQTKLYQNYYFTSAAVLEVLSFFHLTFSLHFAFSFFLAVRHLLAKRSLECATVYVQIEFFACKIRSKALIAKMYRKLFNLTETNIILSRLRI